MKLISVSEMRDIEARANAAGYSYAEMMKTAGEGIAKYIERNHRKAASAYALGLVGGGNNGGDALVALTRLQALGWMTQVILVKERAADDPQIKAYLDKGGEIISPHRLGEIHHFTGIVLDGIYGTGFRPPLPEKVAGLLAEVKKALPKFEWIAVDCPSGVDCERGTVSAGTIAPNVTVCLQAVKKGMMSYSAYPYLGELVTVDLGIEKRLDVVNKTNDILVTEELVCNLLPKRSDYSHKGSYGKVLIIGGCVNYPGAPLLAGRGAYAVGAGLVQVAVPESIYQCPTASSLELTWAILEDAAGAISEIAANTALPFALDASSVVIGPGLGREESTKRFLHKLLLDGIKSDGLGVGFPGIAKQHTRRSHNADMPATVIDADGLYLLKEAAGWFEKLSGKNVLTPHPGEMAWMTGMTVEEVQNDRIEVARKFAQEWKQTLVLKGPLTVIADVTGRIAVIPVATSSLAKAGTGDVLAGMIGGLLAQGLGTWEASIVGAWLHAQAGLLASEEIGCTESVLASDVIRAIPRVYRSQ